MKRGHWIAIVAVAVGLGFCARMQVAEGEAREGADAIVAALQKHKETSGSYPARLEDLGFKTDELRARWSLSYRLQDGKPKLFYSAQNNFLVAYHYDFEAKKWTSAD